MAQEGTGARFDTTHWSVVLAAGSDSTAGAKQALSTLCETYWYPLYAYLRRQGRSAEDAQDLTQGFFQQILEKGTVERADPERGRFRSFLLISLKHYVTNEWDKEQAGKRGGGVRHLSLELENAEGRYQLEPPDDTTPEKVFDRRWALTLLDNVLGKLRAEFVKADKEAIFGRLKVFLGGGSADESYAGIGRELDMSEGAVKVAVHRLRRRYRDLLREEIAQTDPPWVLWTPKKARECAGRCSWAHGSDDGSPRRSSRRRCGSVCGTTAASGRWLGSWT